MPADELDGGGRGLAAGLAELSALMLSIPDVERAVGDVTAVVAAMLPGEPVAGVTIRRGGDVTTVAATDAHTTLVKLAEHGETARPGVVHLAPPNRHLLVESDGRLALSDSELVHFVRPSADLLFESAAGAYGSRAIGCVLTGTGVDGAMGVRAVKDRHGTVVIEDPETAEFKGMPAAALATGVVDFVLPLEEIADVLSSLVGAGESA